MSYCEIVKNEASRTATCIDCHGIIIQKDFRYRIVTMGKIISICNECLQKRAGELVDKKLKEMFKKVN